MEMSDRSKQALKPVKVGLSRPALLQLKQNENWQVQLANIKWPELTDSSNVGTLGMRISMRSEWQTTEQPLSTSWTLEKYGKMLKDNSFIHPHSIFPKNRSAVLLSEEFQPACRRQWPLPLLFSLSSPSLRALANWKWILANWGTLDRSEKLWLAAIGCWCSMVVPCFWLSKYCIEVRLPHLLSHASPWLKSTTIVWLYILYLYYIYYIFVCVCLYL